jgi:DNA-binding XRE family transcriptional regulator
MSEDNELISENWIAFSRWVRDGREALGLTQEMAADKAGIDRQTWYRIEKGGSTKRATIKRIADVLGLDAQEGMAISFGVPYQKKDDILNLDALRDQLVEMIQLMFALPATERVTALAMIQTLHSRYLQTVPEAIESGHELGIEALKRVGPLPGKRIVSVPEKNEEKDIKRS